MYIKILTSEMSRRHCNVIFKLIFVKFYFSISWNIVTFLTHLVSSTPSRGTGTPKKSRSEQKYALKNILKHWSIFKKIIEKIQYLFNIKIGTITQGLKQKLVQRWGFSKNMIIFSNALYILMLWSN